ncbi:MAG: acylphosphatase [Selenomonadaceae bacterium]|nr:acylphosphatase [Selenomonadaceae bacterium]MDY2685548.1 acylphosphatase [Selenomonadaceae bacterium]
MAEQRIRYFGTATGRVQGVGFRMFVQQHAIEHGVTGWVRNMEDGSVTMELQGTEKQLEALCAAIRKGNFFIRVQTFSLEDRPLVPEENGFKIRY